MLESQCQAKVQPCADFDPETNQIEDLEHLLFGNSGDEQHDQHQHHEIIKQSLDIDASCSNMIGDRSKMHILPVIPSAKHTDLYCIAPETVESFGFMFKMIESL